MKKKYKRAGTTSERQDYRKGGQVSKDGPRKKFYPGGIGDGDIGLSNWEAGFSQAIAQDTLQEYIEESTCNSTTTTTTTTRPYNRSSKKSTTQEKIWH